MNIRFTYLCTVWVLVFTKFHGSFKISSITHYSQHNATFSKLSGNLFEAFSPLRFTSSKLFYVYTIATHNTQIDDTQFANTANHLTICWVFFTFTTQYKKGKKKSDWDSLVGFLLVSVKWKKKKRKNQIWNTPGTHYKLFIDIIDQFLLLYFNLNFWIFRYFIRCTIQFIFSLPIELPKVKIIF